jgi:hypothetical protein
MIDSIQKQSHGMVVIFSDEISLDDLDKANTLFHVQENFEYLRSSIWGLSNGKFSDITKKYMKHIVAADLAALFTLN